MTDELGNGFNCWVPDVLAFNLTSSEVENIVELDLLRGRDLFDDVCCFETVLFG